MSEQQSLIEAEHESRKISEGMVAMLVISCCIVGLMWVVNFLLGML